MPVHYPQSRSRISGLALNPPLGENDVAPLPLTRVTAYPLRGEDIVRDGLRPLLDPVPTEPSPETMAVDDAVIDLTYDHWM